MAQLYWNDPQKKKITVGPAGRPDTVQVSEEVWKDPRMAEALRERGGLVQQAPEGAGVDYEVSVPVAPKPLDTGQKFRLSPTGLLVPIPESELPKYQDVKPEALPFWSNPQRIARYRDVIRSAPPDWQAPPWLDVQGVNDLYDYMSYRNDGKPVQEWQRLADDDPAADYARGMPIPPDEYLWPEEIAYRQQQDTAYQEQQQEGSWNDLETWQKLLLGATDPSGSRNDRPEWTRLTGAAGSAAIGTIGVAALATTIGGPVAGLIAGSLMLGLGAYSSYTGQRIPIFSDLMGVFNLPAQGAEIAIGLAQQINKDGFEYVTTHWDESWKAAQFNYETGKTDLLNIVARIAGDEPAKEGEVWQIGKGISEPVQLNLPRGVEGMVYARSKLEEYEAAGVDPDEAFASVYAEIVDEYGYSGTFSDFVGQTVVDPLNILPFVTGRVGAKIADATGHPRLAQAFKASVGNPVMDLLPPGLQQLAEAVTGIRSSTGLIGTLSNYKSILQTAAVNGAELPRLSRWVAGLDAEGKIKELNPTQPKTGIAGAWQYLNTLTPESKAFSMLENFENWVNKGISDAQGDPVKTVEILRKMAGISPLDVGDEANALYRSPMAATLQASLRAAIQNEGIDNLILKWRASETQRGVLYKMAATVGETPGRVLELIEQDSAGLARRLAEKGGPVVPPETLKELTSLFTGKDAMPFAPEDFRARMGMLVADNVTDHLTKTYNLNPNSTLFRVGKALKTAQSLALLGFNPAYFINNATNNIFTLAIDGLGGMLTGRQIDDWNKRFGVVPSRENVGIGAVGEEVEAASGLYKNMRAGDVVQRITDLLRGVNRKVGLFSNLSQIAEKKASQQATVVGMKRFWSRFWKRGVGFDVMDRDLRSMLPNGMEDQIYSLIEAGMNPEEIANNLFDSGWRPSVDSVIDTVAQSIDHMAPEAVREALQSLGIDDKLKTRLKEANSPDEVAKVFEDVERELDDQIELYHTQRLETEAQEVVTKLGAEKIPGLLKLYSDMELERAKKWLNTRHEWDVLYADRLAYNEEQWGAACAAMFAKHNAEWTRFDQVQIERLKGVLDVLNPGNETHQGFMTETIAIHDTWRKFHSEAEKVRRIYFDQMKRKQGETYEEYALRRNAKWNEMQDKLNDLYEKAIGEESKHQMEMDRLFVEGWAPVVGWDAEQAKTWRQVIWDARGELHEMQKRMRELTRNMSAEEKDAAYIDFNREYNARIAQMTEANLRGAYDLAHATPPDGVKVDVPEPAPRNIDIQPEEPTGNAPAVNPELHAIALKNGLVSKNGRPVMRYLLNIVNKYSDATYERIADVPAGIAEAAIEKWKKAHIADRARRAAKLQEDAIRIGQESDANKRAAALKKERLLTRKMVRDTLASEFGVNETEIEAVMALMDSYANVWARGKGLSGEAGRDAWYATAFALDKSKGYPLYSSSASIETPEFLKWFKKSVLVDDAGKPMKMYHGSPNEFDEFSFKYMRTNGTSEGVGFYFTNNREIASGYARTGLPPMEVYLSVQNPMNVKQRKLTRNQIRQIFLEAYKISSDVLSNFGEVEYEGFQKVLNTAVELTFQAGTDLDRISSIGNAGGIGWRDLNRIVTKVTGYDGVLLPREGHNMIVVVFNPEQIKSVNNRGTWDSNDANILRAGVHASAQFLADARAVLKGINAPTVADLVHETGHVFRRWLDPVNKDAVAKLGGLKDADELLDLQQKFDAGQLNPGDADYQRYVDMEENFARGWELYLAEGKAPTSALTRVFQMFTEWLANIYRRLKNLTGKVEAGDQPEFTATGKTVDIHARTADGISLRDVFERMLADEDAKAIQPEPETMEPKFDPDPVKVTATERPTRAEYYVITQDGTYRKVNGTKMNIPGFEQYDLFTVGDNLYEGKTGTLLFSGVKDAAEAAKKLSLMSGKHIPGLIDLYGRRGKVSPRYVMDAPVVEVVKAPEAAAPVEEPPAPVEQAAAKVEQPAPKYSVDVEQIGDFIYFRTEKGLYRAPAGSPPDTDGIPNGARWEAPLHLADTALESQRAFVNKISTPEQPAPQAETPKVETVEPEPVKEQAPQAEPATEATQPEQPAPKAEGEPEPVAVEEPKAEQIPTPQERYDAGEAVPFGDIDLLTLAAGEPGNYDAVPKTGTYVVRAIEKKIGTAKTVAAVYHNGEFVAYLPDNLKDATPFNEAGAVLLGIDPTNGKEWVYLVGDEIKRVDPNRPEVKESLPKFEPAEPVVEQPAAEPAPAPEQSAKTNRRKSRAAVEQPATTTEAPQYSDKPTRKEYYINNQIAKIYEIVEGKKAVIPGYESLDLFWYKNDLYEGSTGSIVAKNTDAKRVIEFLTEKGATEDVLIKLIADFRKKFGTSPRYLTRTNARFQVGDHVWYWDRTKRNYIDDTILRIEDDGQVIVAGATLPLPAETLIPYKNTQLGPQPGYNALDISRGGKVGLSKAEKEKLAADLRDAAERLAGIDPKSIPQYFPKDDLINYDQFDRTPSETAVRIETPAGTFIVETAKQANNLYFILTGDDLPGMEHTVKRGGVLFSESPASALFAKNTEEMTAEELRYVVKHDELTGLKSRRAFREDPRKPFLMMIDVEGLKWVNDTYGHQHGDQVMIAAANSLREVAGEEFSYRGSERGDELIGQFATEEEAKAAAQKIRDVIDAQVITINGKPMKGLGVAAGIGRTLEEADLAMNARKVIDTQQGRRANRGEKPVNLREEEAPRAVAGGTPDAEPYGQAMDEMTTEYLRPVLRSVRNEYQRQAGQQRPTVTSLPPDVQERVRSYVKRVSNQMSGAKLATMKAGTAARDFALLNYTRRYGADNIADLFLPYQFWMTRSMVNWGKRMIDKPAWAAMYARYKQMQERIEKQNIPTRFKGQYRILAPFLPDWMGNSVFINPLKNLLPVEQFAQPFDQLAKDKSQLDKRAASILQEMVRSGEIGGSEARSATASKSGPTWEEAVKRAELDMDKEISPTNIASMMMSPALWWSLPYNLATGNAAKINPFPITRTGNAIQAALTGTPLEGIGKVAGAVMAGPERIIRKAGGLSEFGQWGDYYVDRMLANMAGDGSADPNQVLTAMIERRGPVYEQAYERARMEMSAKVPGALTLNRLASGDFVGAAQSIPTILFPAGLFPEGELKQRGLSQEYNRAWELYTRGDDKALTRFFDENPEYEARLALFKKPEERLRQFLIGQIWDKYTQLGPADQGMARQQLGTDFVDGFLNKETADPSGIDPRILAMWSRMLGGNAPATDQTAGAETTAPMAGMGDAVNAAVEQYRAERSQKFPMYYALQNEYYRLPTNKRSEFLRRFPNLKKYWDWKDQYTQANPQVAAYLDQMNQPEGLLDVEINNIDPALVTFLKDSPNLPAAALQEVQRLLKASGRKMNVNEYILFLRGAID